MKDITLRAQRTYQYAPSVPEFADNQLTLEMSCPDPYEYTTELFIRVFSEDYCFMGSDTRTLTGKIPRKTHFHIDSRTGKQRRDGLRTEIKRKAVLLDGFLLTSLTVVNLSHSGKERSVEGVAGLFLQRLLKQDNCPVEAVGLHTAEGMFRQFLIGLRPGAQGEESCESPCNEFLHVGRMFYECADKDRSYFPYLCLKDLKKA